MIGEANGHKDARLASEAENQFFPFYRAL